MVLWGNETWQHLLQNKYNPEAIDEDTDSQSTVWQTNYNQTVHRYYLPKGEYLDGPIKNEYCIFTSYSWIDTQSI